METRKHEEPETLITAWQRYAMNGDTLAQSIVDRDVRRFMEDTGETDYSAAMRVRRQEVRELEAIRTPGRVRADVRDRHYAGEELLRVAQEYRKGRPDLTHKEAFHLALLSNPLMAEQYTGFPVRRDAAQEVANYLNQETDTRNPETATERLATFVDAVPKLPDRTRDWPEVVRKVFQHPDTVEQAARETMERLIKEIIKEESIWFHPLEYDDVKRKLELRLRAKHPDLSNTLDHPHNVNERALKLIFNATECT